jgi:hypothetical protein
MPISDLDIRRTAHLWIQQHGETALAKAREKLEKMRHRGDTEGADTWLRIIVAMGMLGTPSTRYAAWRCANPPQPLTHVYSATIVAIGRGIAVRVCLAPLPSKGILALGALRW